MIAIGLVREGAHSREEGQPPPISKRLKIKIYLSEIGRYYNPFREYQLNNPNNKRFLANLTIVPHGDNICL